MPKAIPPRPLKSRGPLTIALAGQPNVGKSTVFNMLTGLSQHVGNWPGKTVEQKTGEFKHNGRVVRLVDLPGTYSLTANSEEERIARDFILRERPDAVALIVNAAALERNLYLLAELLALPVPVVVGLNMVDVAESHKMHVEPHVLEAALRLPVIPLVATQNRGLQELMDAAQRLAERPEEFAPCRPTISEQHRIILEQIQTLLDSQSPPPYPEKWVALKLLEGDAEITDQIRRLEPQLWQQIHPLLMQHEDAFLDIASGRYEWIGRMVRAAVVHPKAGVISLTDRLDKVATHPFWGLLILLAMFGGVFSLTYTLATPLVDWLDRHVVAALAGWVETWLTSAPAWLLGLIVDGLIGGAGTVLTFLPILVIFFAVLGTLEDVGYLARSGYVMDRFMHWMGLHGRSFIPLFLGFGCNVPAVMGARIIENRPARLLTILMAPLVPCTARLAVVAFLAPALLGDLALWASWGLVGLNLLLVALLGVLLNRLLFHGERAAFIMEMPLYHLPNLRTIGLYIWNNTLGFVQKAGTIIVLVSMLVWGLAYFPEGNLEQSLLAGFGRWLEPLGRLMGIADWRPMVALLTSFIAKENTIAVLGILYNAGAEAGRLAESVAQTMSPASALAFLILQMLFIPCVATMSAIKQETSSWRWTLLVIGLLLFLSFAAAILAYQIARGMGWGM